MRAFPSIQAHQEQEEAAHARGWLRGAGAGEGEF